MIDLLFLNSTNLSINSVLECFDKYNCNSTEVNNTYEAFKELKHRRFDAIIIASDFSDISVVLFVKLLKLNTRYTKFAIIHNLNSEAEEKLYGLDVDNIIDYKKEPKLMNLKIDKFLKGLYMESHNKIIDVGTDIVIDLDTKVVKKLGKTVRVSDVEFNILEFLITNKNTVLSRKQIEKNVWGNNISDFDNRVIDVYILRLRRKLDIKCIETIRGIGYCWQTSNKNSSAYKN